MRIVSRAISRMSTSSLQVVASSSLPISSSTNTTPALSALQNGDGSKRLDIHPKRPVSGLIGVLKPSGQTSMSMLVAIKPLLAQSKYFQIPDNIEDLDRNPNHKGKKKRRRNFNRYTDGNGYIAPKIGQGGTLDPLADGVLVLGIGAGTKRLGSYLDCIKEYRTTGLLGSSTLSYDADDPILIRRRYDHVDADSIRNALPSFRGKLKQMPPLYSAIRIDGKKLYDYAREGIDLPRPVERRDIEVSYLELEEWELDHSYKEPQQECNAEERKVAMRARLLAGLDEPSSEGEAEAIPSSTEANESSTNKVPPAFTLRMTVSSGTYVRSIVHDVGMHVKSAAHVVKLSRTRQGNWISPDYLHKEGEDGSKLKKAVDWSILQNAADELARKSKRQRVDENDADDDAAANNRTEFDAEINNDDEEGPAEWEKVLLQHMQIIE